MRSRLLALVYVCSLFTCLDDALRVSLQRPGAQRETVSQAATATPMTYVARPASAVDAGAERERPRSARDRQSPGAVAPASAPDVPEAQTYYAWARHVERAEQRVDAAQLFDFGAPSVAQYVFGGLPAQRAELQQVAATWALRAAAHDLKLILPADRANYAQLLLHVKSFGPAQLTALLNGRELAAIPLAGERFEPVPLPLKPGLLRHGDNVLELRVAASGEPDSRSRALRGRSGFALRALAWSDTAADVADLEPVSLAELQPGSDRLQLPPKHTLSYTFQVPEHAYWSARAWADAPAELTLHVSRDGVADEELDSFQLDGHSRELRAPLDDYAGQLVRLALSAKGHRVVLEAPEIRSPPRQPPRAAASRRPRNVILYVIDTLRADRLTTYSPDTRVRTPQLSHFAEHAAVLTAARSQENWTKPSVATLLSSLYPWQHETLHTESVLPSSVELLPEVLSARGFYTGALIANGYVSDKFGFNQGFQTYRNYIREGQRSNAEIVAADVLAWLDARPRDQPFFLYVHTIDPHVPYLPPREFLALYDAEPYYGPVTFARSAELLDQIKLGQLALDDRDRQHLVALYDGEVSYHDAHFGAILDGLDARGLQDDTLVVVTADHGEEFWDHGSVGHGHSLFDELLRVPLLVRVPGVTQAGDRIAADVGLIDVAPTILEALGEQPPEAMRGRSFFPELSGGAADAPRTSAAGFMTGYRALCAGRYKLVQHSLLHSFLYDTWEDPGETRDLSAERPLALAYVRGLLGLTLSGVSSTGAPHPSVHRAETTAIDAATEQQLRALGYVGSSQP
jgi:arylsulfatase A-like enzyme